jgi:hypothetical protein
VPPKVNADKKNFNGHQPAGSILTLPPILADEPPVERGCGQAQPQHIAGTRKALETK